MINDFFAPKILLECWLSVRSRTYWLFISMASWFCSSLLRALTCYSMVELAIRNPLGGIRILVLFWMSYDCFCITSSEWLLIIFRPVIGSHLILRRFPSLISCRWSSVSLKRSYPSSKFRLNFLPMIMFCSSRSFCICLKNGFSRQSSMAPKNGATVA